MRRRCPRGHLIEERKKTYCATCRQIARYHTDSEYRAKHVKARLGRYYKLRVGYGLDAAIATYKIVPGDKTETERRLSRNRELNRLRVRRYYERWGNINSNIHHRLRWQQIRSGEWREEDHPLAQ